jgi:hypothetical protein
MVVSCMGIVKYEFRFDVVVFRWWINCAQFVHLWWYIIFKLVNMDFNLM